MRLTNQSKVTLLEVVMPGRILTQEIWFQKAQLLTRDPSLTFLTYIRWLLTGPHVNEQYLMVCT